MKIQLLVLGISTIATCLSAHAREYYHYESVGHNHPEYIEYDGAHYARVPQTSKQQNEHLQAKPKEAPRFTRLTDEQSNRATLKQQAITTSSFGLHPYIGIEGAKGKIKHIDDYKTLFPSSTKRFGVFGGLQFNQYIGLEAFYNMGNTQKKSAEIENDIVSVDATDKLNFNAYGLDLLTYLPATKSIDVIFGLGYGWYTFKGKMKGELYHSYAMETYPINYQEKQKDEAIRITLGAQYLINENWAIRLLGRYADFMDGNAVQNIQELSLGVRYMF